MGTNITFSGAGFLGVYHIGVVSCFEFYAKKLLDEIKCYGGCSAGALAACMLICDLDLEECVKLVMHQASKVHQKLLGPMSLDFDPSAQIRSSCKKYLPVDAYERATGKLSISLTRVYDMRNVIVSEYSSNEDLIDALVCTCFIPIFSGITPPRFKGVAYVDGGFTDNLPQTFEGTTITVSPFGGENDICPDDRHKSNSQFDFNNTNVQFSCHNLYRMTRALFPPNNDVLIKMCCNGFNDALKYLYKNYAEMLDFDMKIVSVPKCCEFALLKKPREDTVDGYSDICSSCGNESETSLNEVENRIAKERVLSNIVFPEQLSQILQETKLFLAEDNLNWYVVKSLAQASEWIAKPCQYSAKQMMSLSKTILESAVPKLKWVGSYNFYTQKVVDYASKGFHAYKETAQYEWHPSIDEEDQIHIQKRKERLKTVERSFVALPSRKLSIDDNGVRRDCYKIKNSTENNVVGNGDIKTDGTPSSVSTAAIDDDDDADTRRNISFDLRECFDSQNSPTVFSISGTVGADGEPGDYSDNEENYTQNRITSSVYSNLNENIEANSESNYGGIFNLSSFVNDIISKGMDYL